MKLCNVIPVTAFCLLISLSLLRGQLLAPGNYHRLIGNPTTSVPSIPTPSNVATLAHWWVASDLATGSTVTSWVDRINYKPATNRTAHAPTNSSSGVRFNGYTDGDLQLDYYITQTNGTGSLWCVFVADAYTSGPTREGIIGPWNSGDTFGLGTKANNTMIYRSSVEVTVGTYTPGSYIDVGVAMRGSGSTNVYYVNGVAVLTNTVGTTLYPFGRFGVFQYNDWAWNGYLTEVAYYGGRLEASNFSALHTYATNRYSYSP